MALIDPRARSVLEQIRKKRREEAEIQRRRTTAPEPGRSVASTQPVNKTYDFFNRQIQKQGATQTQPQQQKPAQPKPAQSQPARQKPKSQQAPRVLGPQPPVSGSSFVPEPTKERKLDFSFAKDPVTGLVKDYSQISLADVYASFVQAPHEKRVVLEQQFKTDYLIRPGQKFYSPYYAEGTNNADFVKYFGTDNMDDVLSDPAYKEKLLPHVRWNAAGTSPLKPGKKSPRIEWEAYTYFYADQDAKESKAVKAEEPALYAQLNQLIADNPDATEDEIIGMIDYDATDDNGDKALKNIKSFRDAAAVGGAKKTANGGLLIDDEPMRAAIRAGKAGVDISVPKDYIALEALERLNQNKPAMDNPDKSSATPNKPKGFFDYFANDYLPKSGGILGSEGAPASAPYVGNVFNKLGSAFAGKAPTNPIEQSIESTGFMDLRDTRIPPSEWQWLIDSRLASPDQAKALIGAAGVVDEASGMVPGGAMTQSVGGVQTIRELVDTRAALQSQLDDLLNFNDESKATAIQGEIDKLEWNLSNGGDPDTILPKLDAYYKQLGEWSGSAADSQNREAAIERLKSTIDGLTEGINALRARKANPPETRSEYTARVLNIDINAEQRQIEQLTQIDNDIVDQYNVLVNRIAEADRSVGGYTEAAAKADPELWGTYQQREADKVARDQLVAQMAEQGVDITDPTKISNDILKKKMELRDAAMLQGSALPIIESSEFGGDYDIYAARGLALRNPEPTLYDLTIGGGVPGVIQNQATYARDHAKDIIVSLNHNSSYKSSQLVDLNDMTYMSDEQLATYSYYLANPAYGKKRADLYFEGIRPLLRSIQGERIAGSVKGHPVWELGVSAAAGIERGGIGLAQVFSSDPIPRTQLEFAYPLIQQDLANYGPKLPDGLGGRSLMQVLGDAAYTGGNMTMAIAANAAVPGVGPVIIGAGTAGNTYRDAIFAGRSRDGAMKRAVLTGLAEAYMSSLLGVSATGGGQLVKMVGAKTASAMTGAFSDVMKGLALTMGSNGTEEYLQEVISPLLDKLAYDDEFNGLNLSDPEALYSGLMGALTAVITDSPGIVGKIYGTAKLGAEFNTPEKIADLILTGQLARDGSKAQTDAEAALKRVEKKGSMDALGNYRVGKLSASVFREMTDAASAPLEPAPEPAPEPEAPAAPEEPAPETADKLDPTEEIELDAGDIAVVETKARSVARDIIENAKGFTGKLQRLFESAQSVEKLYHDALRAEMTLNNKVRDLARETGRIMQDVANGVIESSAGFAKIMKNSRDSADAKTEAAKYNEQRVKLSEDNQAAQLELADAKGELYRATYEFELNKGLREARQAKYEKMVADEAIANEAARVDAESKSAVARQAEIDAQDAELANQEAAMAQSVNSLKRAAQQALDDENTALEGIEKKTHSAADAEAASKTARSAYSSLEAAQRQVENVTKRREALAKERAELAGKIVVASPGSVDQRQPGVAASPVNPTVVTAPGSTDQLAPGAGAQPASPDESAKTDSAPATPALPEGMPAFDPNETPATKIKRFLKMRFPHAQVDPKTLKVDPEAYQFRSGADKKGVTKPMQGDYSPMYSDDIVVHERLNGDMYVADGHHRTEFAVRKNIDAVDVIILREADGVTVEDARLLAAARNMSQNHGEPIDAAKIFRDAAIKAGDLAELGLTATNSVIEKGFALAQLTNEYWKRTISGGIDEFTGYIMGKYFPLNEKMQAAYMQFMGQRGGNKLSNTAKEELAKILDGAETNINRPDEQFSFDIFDQFNSNALEMAEVAARVNSKISRMYTLFDSLSKENKQALIESVGQNRLDAEANDKKAGNVSIAAALMKNYTTGGKVRDIISGYAKQYAEKTLTLDKAAQQATDEIIKLAQEGGLVIGGIDNTQTSVPVGEGTGKTKQGEEAGKGKPAKEGKPETLQASNALAPLAPAAPASTTSTAAEQSIIKRASAIAKELYGHFNQVFTTRHQHPVIRSGKALGAYELHSGAINTRTFQSMIVYAHELGHAIFEKAGMFDAHRQPHASIKSDIDAMVVNLQASQPAFAASYPPDQLPGEAAAEFVRAFLTDRNHAVAFAGEDFVKRFETQMLTPDQLKAMRKARGQFGYLLLAEPLQQRIARIDYGDSSANAFDGSFGRFVQGWADKYYSVLRFDEQANRLGYDNKDAKKRAYVAFSNIAYSITQAGGIVNHGLITPETGRQVNVFMKDGRQIAGSFSGIMKQITKELQAEFDTYLLSLHDIDRQAQGKPVYGDYTAKDSEKVVADLEAKYPHFKDVQQELVRWWDAFIDEWVVKPNSIENAAEKVALFRRLYPNYVPTFRSKSDRVDVMTEHFGDMGGLIGQASVHFRKAKGGDEALKSPVLSFVVRIGEIVTATNKVLAMRKIHEAYTATPGLANYIRDVTGITDNNGGENLLKVIDENGDVHKYQVFDKLLYESLLNGGSKEDKAFWNAVGSVTGVFKSLTTVSNPIFAFSNAPRDFMEAFTKGSENNLLKFTWQWVDAIIELCKREKNRPEALKKYYGMGGGDSSISPRERRGVNEIERAVYGKVFTGSLNRIAHGRNFKDRVMGGEAALHYAGAKLKEGINAFNNVVEGSQRYAEFKRTLNKTGDASLAMYNSANVTTDFRRMGNSNLNYVARQVFAFMNAGIQGTYSWYRMSKEARYDKKAFAMKALKAASMFAMVPLAQYLLMAMLGGDDKKAYDLLPDNIKEDNYIIPKYWLADRGNGTDRFMKIPKAKGPIPAIGDAIGRSLAEAIDKEGSWDAFVNYDAADWLKRKGGNLFDAVNPFGSPVFAPVAQIMMNQSWYDSPIEPSWMRSENISPANRIKQNTSSLAVYLAHMGPLYNKVSPIQVDYFLNQSFGILGDYATSKFGNSLLDGMSAGDTAKAFGTSTMKFIVSRLNTDPTAASDVTNALYDINDVIMGIASDATLKGDNLNPYANINNGLSEAERKAAVGAAKALTKKGGALYKAKKLTTAHYNELEELMASDKTDDEKNAEMRKIKMQMLIENAEALDKAERFMRMYVLGTPAKYKQVYGE